MQAQRFSLHLLLITRMRPSSPLLASELLHDDFRKKVTNVTFPLLSLFCRKAEKLSTQRCKASFTASFCRKSFRPRCWTNSAFAWIKAPHISQRPTPPCGTSSRRLQIATDIHKCRYMTATHCGKSLNSAFGRSVLLLHKCRFQFSRWKDLFEGKGQPWRLGKFFGDVSFAIGDHGEGFEKELEGAVLQDAKKCDRFVTKELMNNLFNNKKMAKEEHFNLQGIIFPLNI